MSRVHNAICVDFETGGRNARKNETTNEPANPVIEIAAIAFDPKTKKRLGEFSKIVLPYSDELVYEKEAETVHGITQADIQAGGEPIKDVAKEFVTFCRRFSEQRRKPFIVGHNVGFDLGFLQQFLTYGGKSKEYAKLFEGYQDYSGNFVPYIEDTLYMSRNFWAGVKESFSLSDCCAYADINLNGAHRALNDVAATVELYNHIRAGSGDVSKKTESKKVFVYDILK